MTPVAFIEHSVWPKAVLETRRTSRDSRQHLVKWGGVIVGWLRDPLIVRTPRNGPVRHIVGIQRLSFGQCRPFTCVSARRACGIPTNKPPARNRAYRRHWNR